MVYEQNDHNSLYTVAQCSHMNDNLKWSLITSFPLGLAMTLMNPNFTLSNPWEFAGGVFGGMIVFTLILYVALQYVLNRPKKT